LAISNVEEYDQSLLLKFLLIQVEGSAEEVFVSEELTNHFDGFND